MGCPIFLTRPALCGLCLAQRAVSPVLTRCLFVNPLAGNTVELQVAHPLLLVKGLEGPNKGLQGPNQLAQTSTEHSSMEQCKLFQAMHFVPLGHSFGPKVHIHGTKKLLHFKLLTWFQKNAWMVTPHCHALWSTSILKNSGARAAQGSNHTATHCQSIRADANLTCRAT